VSRNKSANWILFKWSSLRVRRDEKIILFSSTLFFIASFFKFLLAVILPSGNHSTLPSKVDGSVLWLPEGNITANKNLKKEAIKNSVDENRIIFSSRLTLREDHLNRIQLADLFLDTTPYNAHATTSDALQAGLPVLTCIGNSFASRVAASLLNALNLPELITNTQEQYESLAIQLATHPEKLKIIKEKLNNNLIKSPLYNTPLYTQHLESAYTMMYDRYQRDLDPDHIYVKH
jgi:predicted O-linked N-acetylglucosamine transferase (SPINDLY family)